MLPPVLPHPTRTKARLICWPWICTVLCWLPPGLEAAVDADEIIEGYRLLSFYSNNLVNYGGHRHSQQYGCSLYRTFHVRSNHADPWLREHEEKFGHRGHLMTTLDATPEYLQGMVPILRIGDAVLWTQADPKFYDQRAHEFVTQWFFDKIDQYNRQLVPGKTPIPRPEISRLPSVQLRKRDEGSLHRLGASDELSQQQMDALREALGKLTSDQFYEVVGFGLSPIISPDANSLERYAKAYQVDETEMYPPRPELFVVAADAPKQRLESLGLIPLVQFGRWGFFLHSSVPEILRNDIRYAILLLLNTRKFQESISHLGVKPAIGGAEELRQLLARTPDRKPAAALPVAAPTAAPVQSAPVASAAVESNPYNPRGTNVQAEVDPRLRGVCLLGPPQSEELKRKLAQDQARFRERLAEKSARYQEWKKQQSAEAVARYQRNREAFDEFLRRDAQAWRQKDRDWMEHLKREGSRRDAIETTLEKGPPAQWRFHNRTSVHLHVVIRYTGTIKGKQVTPLVVHLTVPAGRSTWQHAGSFTAASLAGEEWEIDPHTVTWEARPQDNARF